ncbi:MAG: cytosolic protein [Micromonosporaceae bacterium]|nr:cytosolic protein [Micromonosporaceae bacterium]
MDHPHPSARAREIVAGGYDTHVHVAPDVVPRLIDDLSLARRFRDVGLAGFVLKSHYVPTAERAAVVRAAVLGVDVLGAVTLNRPVGGMNAVAVEIAARGGARVVWFPTVDSVNQRSSRAEAPAGAIPPMWAALQEELRAEGIDPPPVAVMDESGGVRPDVRDVLQMMAKRDLVLATGHLSASEILLVVRAARDAGVRRIIVTHPEFTSQRLTVAQQQELAGLGAFLERCFTTPHTGKVAWDLMIENIRQVGPRHSVLSSDLGQPSNPPVEDGLALMADHLLAAGVSADDIHQMAVTNTVHLARDTTAAVGSTA